MKGTPRIDISSLSGAISTATLHCSLNCSGLNASVSSATINCTVDSNAIFGDIVLEGLTIIEEVDLPYYDESYNVTPRVDEVKLPTKGKAMSDDITVNPIPYYETSNEFGHTVYIRGE